MHFAQNSDAVPWGWPKGQKAQACCEASLQSSTEQWGRHFALTSAAVHWSCITAHLYEEQISIGVSALAQACWHQFAVDTHTCINSKFP